MTVEEMRAAIAQLYGPGWKWRVSGMSENQVIAVYFSLLERGAFDKKSTKPAKKAKVEGKFEPFGPGVQLSLF